MIFRCLLCTSEEWNEKAKVRKEKMNELCWNEESSMYFDYDFVNKKQFPFEARQPHFFPRLECAANIR
jgi:alpha,alpha-trehalase